MFLQGSEIKIRELMQKTTTSISQKFGYYHRRAATCCCTVSQSKAERICAEVPPLCPGEGVPLHSPADPDVGREMKTSLSPDLIKR